MYQPGNAVDQRLHTTNQSDSRAHAPRRFGVSNNIYLKDPFNIGYDSNTNYIIKAMPWENNRYGYQNQSKVFDPQSQHYPTYGHISNSPTPYPYHHHQEEYSTEIRAHSQQVFPGSMRYDTHGSLASENYWRTEEHAADYDARRNGQLDDVTTPRDKDDETKNGKNLNMSDVRNNCNSDTMNNGDKQTSQGGNMNDQMTNPLVAPSPRKSSPAHGPSIDNNESFSSPDRRLQNHEKIHEIKDLNDKIKELKLEIEETQKSRDRNVSKLEEERSRAISDQADTRVALENALRERDDAIAMCRVAVKERDEAMAYANSVKEWASEFCGDTINVEVGSEENTSRNLELALRKVHLLENALSRSLAKNQEKAESQDPKKALNAEIEIQSMLSTFEERKTALNEARAAVAILDSKLMLSQQELVNVKSKYKKLKWRLEETLKEHAVELKLSNNRINNLTHILNEINSSKQKKKSSRSKLASEMIHTGAKIKNDNQYDVDYRRNGVKDGSENV